MNDAPSGGGHKVTTADVQAAVLLSKEQSSGQLAETERRISGQLAEMERRLLARWEALGATLNLLQSRAGIHEDRLSALQERVAKAEAEISGLAKDTTALIGVDDRVETLEKKTESLGSLGDRLDAIEKARETAGVHWWDIARIGMTVLASSVVSAGVGVLVATLRHP